MFDQDFAVPSFPALSPDKEYTYYDESEIAIGIGPVLNLKAILAEIEAILEMEYRLVNVYVRPDWLTIKN